MDPGKPQNSQKELEKKPTKGEARMPGERKRSEQQVGRRLEMPWDLAPEPSAGVHGTVRAMSGWVPLPAGAP